MMHICKPVLRAVCLLALSGYTGNTYALSPSDSSISAGAASAMLNEADDFIDSMPDGMQDRQADAVLHALRGMGGELDGIRAQRNKSDFVLPAGVRADAIAGDGSARGIAMRLYRPEGVSSGMPMLVYLHGGGWTFGGLNSCARFCADLASRGVAVLAVDYALAPANPAPRPMLDCVAAVEYAMAHADGWGVDPGRVSIGGDSSGGNLAIASALYRAADASAKGAVKSLVLFYPVTKAYNDQSSSWKKYSRGYGLDGRLMQAFNLAYLGRDINPDDIAKETSGDAYISPGDSDLKVLKGLPPVLLVAAERDILCDQGREFAERLREAGVKSQRHELPGAVHLFITVQGQPTAYAQALQLAADCLLGR